MDQKVKETMKKFQMQRTNSSLGIFLTDLSTTRHQNIIKKIDMEGFFFNVNK